MQGIPPGSRIPVSLLTGFLGSGKTTLLRESLRQPAMAGTAVLINEFGAIGLDHDLVQAVDAETVLMDGGCLCCTVRDDLAVTLAEMLRKRADGRVPPFRRVIIETTGLADPVPILQVLIKHADIARAFALDGVVATLDAVNAPAQLDAHPESVRQVAVADRIVLTKSDLVAFLEPARLIARIRQLNPAAEVILAQQGVADAGRIFLGAYENDPLRIERALRRFDEAQARGEAVHACEDPGCAHPAHAHRHDARFQSHVLRFDEPLEWAAVADWLGGLAFFHGDRLLRIKGILNLRDEAVPVAVHGVRRLFHPPVRLDGWPDGDRRSRLVFIADGVERGVLVPPF